MKDKFFYYIQPWGKVLLFVLVIFLVMLPVAAVIQTPPLSSFLESSDEKNRAFLEETIFALVALVAVAATIKLYRYSWNDVFYRKDFLTRGLGGGIVIGAIMMLVIGGILLLLGFVDFQYTQLPYQNLMPLALLFFSVAVFEEFLFRSFVLTVFLERYPLLFAVGINGLLFACAHLGNPGLTFIGFFNIVLAGILFSIFVIAKWNIGWAIGLHFGWNTMMGGVLGYPVSGLKSKGTFVAKSAGSPFLSGGTFGPEGSIICTVVLLTVIVFLFYKFQLHPLATLEEEQEVGEIVET